MLLCIDVGNTNTVLGVYDLAAGGGPRLRDSFRVQTEKDRTGDEYGLPCAALAAPGDPCPCTARVGSVGPRMTASCWPTAA
jgi:pantothenate kinase type III